LDIGESPISHTQEKFPESQKVALARRFKRHAIAAMQAGEGIRTAHILAFIRHCRTFSHNRSMTMQHADTTFPADRELVLSRLIDAPPAHVYRVWTEPALLQQWFAPAPWTTPLAQLDVRPGGASVITMRGPDGQESTYHGVYLDVVENQKLVFTDAFTSAWEPSEKAFMTVIASFAEEAGKTRYTARVRHWSSADRATHEQMGFAQGWGLCADQMAAVAASL